MNTVVEREGLSVVLTRYCNHEKTREAFMAQNFTRHTRQ